MFQSFWYGIGRTLMAFLARVIFHMDIVWKGIRPAGPVILAANHPTTTDPAMITTLVPEQTSILIKHVLFKVPLFGRSLRMSGHIPLIPGNGRASLEEAERLLRAGRTIVFFPEGEISHVDGRMQKPHSGLARLALATGAPVIPVGISVDTKCVQLIETVVEGKKELGTWYFHGPYAMTVGKPMRFTGSVEDHDLVRRVTGQVMRHIEDLAYESRCRIATGQYAMSLPVKVVNFGLRLVLTV